MIDIRKATLQDVSQLVSIHCDAFPNFFLTNLGHNFLFFYYSCFLRSRDSVVICAENDNKILGFSATSKYSRGFNLRLIMNNLFRFLIISMRLLMINPRALVRLIGNLIKKNNTILDKEDYAEIYSIAVKKGFQGKGIGKELLLETEKQLKIFGVNSLSLTTDYFNNKATISFYKSMGFSVLYEFVAYPQRKMYRFLKNI